MIAENFTAELTAFVSSLIEGAPYKSSDEWTMKLKSKIKVLVEEYWSKPMQFIVGDASADGDGM